jgi:uncharacterized repeat protein (TIGR03809 family)
MEASRGASFETPRKSAAPQDDGGGCSSHRASARIPAMSRRGLTVDWEDNPHIRSAFCRWPPRQSRYRWTKQKFSTEYPRTDKLIRPVALASVFLLADFSMAQRPDAARGQERAQEILDRWCALAEQRLDHLTELFETGRWRRYHSELSFLENIQEAKNAVETWRRLATREAALDNSAIDISWLNNSKPVPPRRNPLAGYHVPPPPRRADIVAAPEIVEASIVPGMSEGISESVVQAAVPEQTASLDVTPTPPVDNSWQQALDLSVMQERYPLLRNAL